MGFYYLAAMAVMCGGMAGFLAWRRMAFLLFAERAEGQFVRWRRSGRHNFPVVRFTTKEGRVCEFAGGVGTTDEPDYHRFKVLYPPGQPDKAMIADVLHFWAGPLGFLVLAGVAAYAASEQ